MLTVIRFQVSRGTKDCAIVALSTYLERSYEDVLGEAVAVTKSRAPHNRGLYTREIRQIARRFGMPLRLRRKFDLGCDEGIFGFIGKGVEHVAFCTRGLVWDTDGSVVKAAAYCAMTNYKPVSLLEKVDE